MIEDIITLDKESQKMQECSLDSDTIKDYIGDEPYSRDDVKLFFDENYESFDFRSSIDFVNGKYNEKGKADFISESYDSMYEDVKEQIIEYDSESLYNRNEEENNIKEDISGEDDSPFILKLIKDKMDKETEEWDAEIEEKTDDYGDNLLSYDSASLYDKDNYIDEKDNVVSLDEKISELEKKAA